VSVSAGQGEAGLARVLGRWDLTAIGVNQVIGSGIFVLPASVAALVGAASSPWPFLLAAVANLLIVLCFAEVATRFRRAGGPYVYAREAFGPFVGFEVAWMLWLTRLASLAALANALARYLGYFLPGASVGTGRIVVVSLLIGGLALINLLGVRYGSWTVNFFTVSKLAPLAIFILFGVAAVDRSVFSGFTPTIDAATGEAVLLLLMFAFGGFELITLPAGEAKSPRRDVPFALLSTIGIVCVVFVAVQWVAAGTLPGIATSETPVADAAAVFLGPVGGVRGAIGGLISIAGANAGTMLAGPRVTYALAESGQIPSWFGHVHPRFRTPDVSILLYAGIALALAVSGSFEQMAKVSAVARLLFYLATCAALPVLRRSPAQTDGFRVPGGALVPALAVLVGGAIILGADAVSLLAGAIALVIGAGLYYVASR
jgi:APA family basic amino acid/polyamine antiporter